MSDSCTLSLSRPTSAGVWTLSIRHNPQASRGYKRDATMGRNKRRHANARAEVPSGGVQKTSAPAHSSGEWLKAGFSSLIAHST
jgi:hypothetical protein